VYFLVLIGATPEGRKELVGSTDGAHESAQDWREPEYVGFVQRHAEGGSVTPMQSLRFQSSAASLPHLR
jgi:hypothetical protein